MKDYTQEARYFLKNKVIPNRIGIENPIYLDKLLADFTQQQIIKDRETFLSEKVDKEGNTLKEPLENIDTSRFPMELRRSHERRQEEYQNALTRKQHIQQEAVNDLVSGIEKHCHIEHSESCNKLSSFGQLKCDCGKQIFEQTINKYKR